MNKKKSTEGALCCVDYIFVKKFFSKQNRGIRRTHYAPFLLSITKGQTGLNVLLKFEQVPKNSDGVFLKNECRCRVYLNLIRQNHTGWISRGRSKKFKAFLLREGFEIGRGPLFFAFTTFLLINFLGRSCFIPPLMCGSSNGNDWMNKCFLWLSLSWQLLVHSGGHPTSKTQMSKNFNLTAYS